MWLLTTGFCQCTSTVFLMTDHLPILFSMFSKVLVSSKLNVNCRSSHNLLPLSHKPQLSFLRLVSPFPFNLLHLSFSVPPLLTVRNFLSALSWSMWTFVVQQLLSSPHTLWTFQQYKELALLLRAWMTFPYLPTLSDLHISIFPTWTIPYHVYFIVQQDV